MSHGLVAMLTGEAPGAIKNGSKVTKQNSESNDGHQDGTQGTVLSSIAMPIEVRAEAVAQNLGDCEYFYFIDWGEGVPVGTLDSKVKENAE